MEGSSPVKILLTTDTLGGVWNYSLELIRSARHYPVRFYLVTFGAFLTQMQRQTLQELDNVVLFESNYKLEWMEDCWEDVELSTTWMKEIIHKVEPDLIHLNHFSPAGINA